MSVMLVQVDWTNQDGDTFTFSDVELSNLKRDSEAKASTATVTLKNPINRLVSGYTQPFTVYSSDTNESVFNEGDTVKIYIAKIDVVRDIDTSDTSSDLIMTGEIAEVNCKGIEKGSKIRLKIVDKTWVMLNKLWAFNYNATKAFKAPQIVQDVVRHITAEVSRDPLSFDSAGNLVSNGIYSVDARLVSEGGYIEDTRQDSSAFPTTTIAKVFKPAYEFIKDLSTLEHTNDFSTDDEDNPPQDRIMRFYLDEKNRFHWFYPKDGVTTTLNGAITATDTSITLTDSSSFDSSGRVAIGSELVDYTGNAGNILTGCTRGANNSTAAAHSDAATVTSAYLFIEGDASTGNDIINFNLIKSTFDIVNMVIYNAGKDLLGSGILDYYYDRNTKEKQMKMVKKPYTEIAKELIQGEINAARLTKDNTQAVFTYEGNFYKETTGDYDGGGGITTGWGTSVTSDATYNAAVRAEAKRLAKAKAIALTLRRGSPRWKGTIECRFRRYTAGELINFTSTRAGINAQDLRIKTCQYNITKTSGFVTLTVEEDERKRSD